MTVLAGKRVLVTGGAGFIGSNIVDLLGHEDVASITVLDNMVRGRKENLAGASRVHLVEGDVRDRALLDELVASSDIVFHQAALRITQCAAEPRHAFEVMAEATFNLLEACVKHRIEKVVAASSASIYGMASEFPTRETANPYDDRTLYGGFKLLNESLLRSFNDMYNLKGVALRYFNVIGPRMDINGKYTEVLIRWMERISADLPPVIFGDGNQTMDFIDVRDVARANVLAAKHDEDYEVFNVASGAETSLKNLAGKLSAIMGRNDLHVVHEPARAVNPVPRRLASTEKAKRLLGFEPSISLDEALEDLVNWWRAERSAPIAGAA